MAMDILITEVVERALRRHPHPKVVRDRLRLLAENPHHPSLNAHRVHRIKERDIWECYITRAERALYEIKDGILRLWDLGSHAVVDNVHLRSFAAHTRFSRVDLAPELEAPLEVEVVEPITEPTPSRMTPPKTPVLPPHGTPNRFAFFQNAHLRILGVPANLVQSLKQAPSLELALALPGLPEQTRLWLEELSTSPELDEVMFDSSRLLFRTTLDRLEGYCEGKIKQLMLNLQPEQQQCVDMGRSPLILLKGAAGSGKTTVGIYRAIRLAEQGRRVLIVTFNRTLASVTKSLIEELIGPLPQNLRVTTLHSLMMSILGERAYKLNMDTPQKPQIPQLLEDAMNEVRKRVDASVFKRDKEFFQEEIRRVIKGLGLKNLQDYLQVERFGRKTALKAKQRESVWQVYEAYQRKLARAKISDWSDIALLTLQTLQHRAFPNPYDDIIIDEAQDLVPVDLRVIQQLVAPTTTGTPSSIMILADAAQTLYSRGISWKQAGIQARARNVNLRKNHRNTRQIAEAAAHLLKQNTLMRATNEYVDPECTQRLGPPPNLLTAQNRSNHFASQISQIELVRNRILDLVSDQYFRLSDFAILCPTNKLCEQCKKDLDQFGLRTVLHKDSDFDLLEERIKILTIHSAKGLEFPVVFLLGLTEGELPSTYRIRHLEEEEKQLEIEQQRTLCYVGMTRAAEALYLLTVRGCESRFVKELDGKITVWQSC